MRILVVWLFFLLLLVSCGTAPPGTASVASGVSQGDNRAAQVVAAEVSRSKTEGVYPGTGRSPSLLAALKAAKIDAVRRYVQELLGPERYSFYSDQLQRVVFSTDNPNQYVTADAYETVSKSKEAASDNYVIALQIPVNREAVNQTLLANGIRWAGAPPPSSENVPAASPPSVPADNQSETWGTATPEEQKFIRRYEDTLVYLVYFDEKSSLDPSVLKLGVTRANQILAGKNCDLVDLDQVEKIKDDERKVWEQESGRDAGYLQWVARKLNAGIYVEIGAESRDDFENSLFGAQLNGRLKFFDPSTGELLSEAPFSTPRLLSRTSAADAQMKALQQAVSTVLPPGLDQVKAKLSKSLIRGIRYDLVVQKTVDSKLMGQFRRKLEGQVKLLQVVSASADETRYTVFFLGSAADLEDLVVKTAEKIPGLEGLSQVFVRGRSLTFNSGL